jgi:hypothetical protein
MKNCIKWYLSSELKLGAGQILSSRTPLLGVGIGIGIGVGSSKFEHFTSPISLPCVAPSELSSRQVRPYLGFPRTSGSGSPPGYSMAGFQPSLLLPPAGGVFCNTGYCKCGSEDLRSRRFYPPSPINSASVSVLVSVSGKVRSLNISHFTSLVPPFNSTCQASPLYEIQPGRWPG